MRSLLLGFYRVTTCAGVEDIVLQVRQPHRLRTAPLVIPSLPGSTEGEIKGRPLPGL